MRSSEEEIIKKTLKQIESIKSHTDAPVYDLTQKLSIPIEIKIDNKLEAGKFRPDPNHQGLWYANELTFRAMKKNIFSLDENSLELKDEVQCHRCHFVIDKQFWLMCPSCGASF